MLGTLRVNMDWLNQCFTRLPSYSHSSLALWMVWMECLKMVSGLFAVKLHGVPVMTFSEDGLIAIATELGTSLMLESYTTDMCMQSWLSSYKGCIDPKPRTYIGHKILKSGIEVDRAKVDVIAKLPPPTSVKGIWSFLGHAGFYRRFIQDFSKIARPMIHLLEKETPFIFSTECREAFETLKKKLTEAPILVAPDWDLPFEIMCDVSDFA
ncbi:reverse transcriptase domain-containing protein, partial [Tanacetum coccineum]